MSKKSKNIDAREFPRLLTALAEALNACDDAGLRVRFRHGAVLTQGGFVLPTEGGPWVARSSVYTEFDVDLDEDELDT